MDEITANFGIDVPPSCDVPTETIEGAQGLIVIEKDGLRLLKSAPWGFPRQTREMRQNGEPHSRIGLVADLTNPLWDRTVVDPRYRCLIPMTGFAEAEGVKGSMTRTWFSVKGEPVFAWGGLWRVSDEWSSVYSGAMTNANEAVAPVHDRMPVLLHADEYDLWLHGSLGDLLALQERKYPAASMLMERTNDLWVKKKSTGTEEPALL
ncbi:SOS response-associated peptidase family protein [Rhizobium sp. 1399]|uniref:SOS response-associated peptidase family protein n=1 Tax=Rhizobium sp. 1399 TaxID=2817758 RepID=UPI0028550652|nr:SOS response-associated peptidase family protein [Rhizobium sp. 1399]MDR6670193.1 putative SOS response-associated peptidase YedK [Rhizobium sp. 1399]